MSRVTNKDKKRTTDHQVTGNEMTYFYQSFQKQFDPGPKKEFCIRRISKFVGIKV